MNDARRAYVGLGSNVGPSRETLSWAVERVAALGQLVAVSSLWRTSPRERVDQPPFLNAVVAVEGGSWIDDPAALLAELQAIERAGGRVDRGRYGPRELDLDILLFSAMPAAVRLPALDIPHPRLGERRFALEPLAELAPEEIEPVSRRTVAELLREVRDQGAEPVANGAWWTRA